MTSDLIGALLAGGILGWVACMLAAHIRTTRTQPVYTITVHGHFEPGEFEQLAADVAWLLSISQEEEA